jgi:succinate dehydrogenase/fumarate reductase-like Fe-S protein
MSFNCRDLLCEGSSFKTDISVSGAARKWLEVSDAKVFKVMPVEAGTICRALVGDAMSDVLNAELALSPLWSGLSKMQPTPEHMTPYHAAYLQACASCAYLCQFSDQTYF